MVMRKWSGFNLMEVIIAVALIGILTAIAVPSYRIYILKSHRSDGTNTLLAMQLGQERYRMNNTSYGTLAQTWSNVSSSENGYYLLSISNNTTNTYTLTATAVGDQSSDNQDGTSCSTLTLTFSNNATTKSPAACWR